MITPIEKRLKASLEMDAHNGDAFERSVCVAQAKEAMNEIIRLRKENKRLTDELQAYVDDQDCQVDSGLN